jgi:hypothetical protein
MDRCLIVSNDLALSEEFGLLFSLSLLTVHEVSSEEGEAYGSGNT